MNGAMRWETDSRAPAPWGDLKWMECRGGATTLRSLPGRTVSRVLAPDGTSLVVKAWRARGLFDAFRLLFTQSPGRRERDRALAALARGVDVPRPVALGERRRFGFLRDSLLAMEFVEGVPLDEALASLPPGDARRNSFIESLARFMGSVHDAGVDHRDLHAGNVIARDLEGRARFSLLDLGSARIRSALAPSEREAGLVQINLFLIGRASASERLRFLRSYLGEQAGRREVLAIWARLEQLAARAATRLWERREKRCMAENRDFTSWSSGRMCGRARLGPWPGPGEDPLGAFEAGSSLVVKDSRGSLSVLFQSGGRWIFGKRYRPRGAVEAFRGIFRQSKAVRAWRMSHALEVRGLPTPRVLLAATRRRLGVPVESVLFCEGLPDAKPLDRFAEDARAGGREGAGRLRATLEELGRAVGMLHARGFSHRDLKASNVLVRWDDGPSALVADLDGLLYKRRVRVGRRVKDLARLVRSARDDCGLTMVQVARVLRAYAVVATPIGGWKQVAALLSKAAEKAGDRRAFREE